MEKRPVDRRVRKTKKQLRQGLAELLKTKPVKEISVRELCDFVDINRGTFYLHYRDIYNMLEQTENEMFTEFNETLRNVEFKKENLMQILVAVFEYLANNAELCGALLGPKGDIEFSNRMKAVVHEIWSLNHKQYDDLLDNFEFRYSFLVTGCVGIFETWLSNGMKESPQEMARLVRSLSAGCFEPTGFGVKC